MGRKIGLWALLAAVTLLAGCAVRQGGSTAGTGASEGLNGDELRIAATSPAVMTICERLDLPLVGVPTSSLTAIPERYQDATKLGSPMSPDMEILKSLSPDWVLSPSSLQSDLQPKYEEAGLNYAFLNLKSVPGMYKSIEELGALFGKEAEAQAQIDEYTALYEELEASHEGKEGPTVLLLMGI
ncbi:MAG: ABC transporter substrate-binding protein, partial [Eubacteriales bacterium]|nr:ABC transporter substrate-binding protein [Eubacteriales bacterium]